MDIYKHTAVSLAVSVLILTILKKVQMSIACFLTGVLIDTDHILDYYVNHKRSEGSAYPRPLRKFLTSLLSVYTEHKPFPKVYKVLHSIELLIPFPLLYILGVWNEVATGALIGLTLHMLMDILAFGHIGAVSLIYKISKGFPSGSDIVKHRLSKMGRDIGKCQLCGVRGETSLRIHRSWYIGFTRKALSQIMVICAKCNDRTRDEKN